MKKLISILFILFFTASQTYAENKSNAVMFYDKCNKFIKTSQKENISTFGENLCAFIINKKNNLIVLSKYKNDFSLARLNLNDIEFLKTKYYRGEKIDINITGKLVNLKQILIFKIDDKIYGEYNTLSGNYSIEFLGDNKISKPNTNFPILNKKCSFDSFIPKCNNKTVQNITKKIDLSLSDNFSTKKYDKNPSIEIINIEIEKTGFIIEQISKLKNIYKNKESILLTIEYIIYKLEVYNSVLQNKISDLEFKNYLIQNDIYLITKSIIGDLYISQDDDYTYFYYKHNKINTLNNDISHFDEDVVKDDLKLSSNAEYLREKIREKYSAKYIEGTNNKLALITKKYKSREKYLLFDFDNEKLFTFFGKVQNVEFGKKGYYMIVQNYNGLKTFILYDGNKIHKLSNDNLGYNYTDFELLYGNKISLFYKRNNGKIAIEEIDVSEY